jgi:hypothetical protein
MMQPQGEAEPLRAREAGGGSSTAARRRLAFHSGALALSGVAHVLAGLFGVLLVTAQHWYVSSRRDAGEAAPGDRDDDFSTAARAVLYAASGLAAAWGVSSLALLRARNAVAYLFLALLYLFELLLSCALLAFVAVRDRDGRLVDRASCDTDGCAGAVRLLVFGTLSLGVVLCLSLFLFASAAKAAAGDVDAIDARRRRARASRAPRRDEGYYVSMSDR